MALDLTPQHKAIARLEEGLLRYQIILDSHFFQRQA